MRITLLTALAAASVLLNGLSARNGGAATLEAWRQSESNAAAIHRVANVCGANGCVRVQTQRIQHHKPGSVTAKHI